MGFKTNLFVTLSAFLYSFPILPHYNQKVQKMQYCTLGMYFKAFLVAYYTDFMNGSLMLLYAITKMCLSGIGIKFFEN